MMNVKPVPPLVVLALTMMFSVSTSGSADTAEAPPDLTGGWAMIQYLPEVADLPFIGEVTITAVVGLLVTVEQNGTQVTMHDTYCFTDVHTSSPLLTSEIPDAFMHSLNPDPRTAVLEPSESGWRLVQDWHCEVRGAVLEDPLAEPLPVDAFDPRVVDQDEDGRPGMTVPVTVLDLVRGNTYVVQRLRYRVIGRLVDSDTIEGEIEWTTEQNVITATDALLMLSFDEWPDPDRSKHRFVMRRVRSCSRCERCEALRERPHELIAID
jgi:hypothetical protein